MVDFVLGAFFAGLFVRGWLRGFVKEAMDLAGLFVGFFVAFRFSRQLGEVVESMAQISPTSARYIAGIILFLVVGSAASVGAYYLGKIAHRPGFKTSNRLFGALVATGWGWLLATIVVMLVVVFPLPQAIEDSLDSSVIAGTITDPDGRTQQAVRAVAGDRTFSQVIALEEVFGYQQVILKEGETLELDPVSPDELEIDAAAGQEIFDMLNAARISEGLQPLAYSEALESVGLAHGREMYVVGYFSHESPTTGTVGDRASDAGIAYVLVGENLALAADPVQVHEGLMGSPTHRENILRQEFRRVGIGVIEGPTGLMVVQVFSG